MRIFKRFRRSRKSRLRIPERRKSLSIIRGLKAKQRKVEFYLKGFIGVLVKNRIFKVLIGVVVLIFTIFFTQQILFSSTFDISNIEIQGVQELERSLVSNNLSYLYGKNVFLVRASSLQSDIGDFSPFIKEVKVEKILPNKISILIKEREPIFLWVNLSGAYQVDSEGIVLDVVIDFEDLDISDEDIDLLKGYGNIKELEEEQEEGEESGEGEGQEEEAEDSQSGGDEDEYLQMIEEDRREVVSRVGRYWEQNLETIPEDYKRFPFVYSYEKGDLNVLDNLDPLLVSSTKIGLEIDFLGEEIISYIWESNYRFVLYLSQRRCIVLTTRREFEDQLEDLKVLIAEIKSKGEDFSYIDLSSEVILYEQ
jgi:cell division septal protein FtsQ